MIRQKLHILLLKSKINFFFLNYKSFEKNIEFYAIQSFHRFKLKALKYIDFL